jgi:5-methyltetrahydrofolate--homocysteine methyltransferase
MRLEEIAEFIIRGDADCAGRLTQRALQEGFSAEMVLENGLMAGMGVIGRKFRDNEIFVPEVLLAARAMKAAMTHLEPILAACGIEPTGRFVIGTVKGDIHDIGKNLVGMMLRGAGFEVVDLGTNVSAERFIEAIEQHEPHIVGMSALLTTTMAQMGVNLKMFQQAGVRERIKVMVGGAPITPEFAEAIGADAYGHDAAEAAEKAMELLK